jgi:hypothetical protein
MNELMDEWMEAGFYVAPRRAIKMKGNNEWEISRFDMTVEISNYF